MKTPLALIALAALSFALAGCLTPQQQEWTCERAQDALAAYQGAELAGLVSDPKVIASVKVAAAFLHSYCGWSLPATRATPPIGGLPSRVDRNGVLIVLPP